MTGTRRDPTVSLRYSSEKFPGVNAFLTINGSPGTMLPVETLKWDEKLKTKADLEGNSGSEVMSEIVRGELRI